jgi:YHS domain-containing protein
MKYILFVWALLICSPIDGQTAALNPSVHLNVKKGLALEGYDPVSYFSRSAPAKGKSDITHVYKGITYRFSNMENKKRFESMPEAFLPQYGGWCAYAIGDYGKKVEVDPKTFKIVDGKLYLFYHTLLQNTLLTWNKDEKNLMMNADKNWATILKQKN